MVRLLPMPPRPHKLTPEQLEQLMRRPGPHQFHIFEFLTASGSLSDQPQAVNDRLCSCPPNGNPPKNSAFASASRRDCCFTFDPELDAVVDNEELRLVNVRRRPSDAYARLLAPSFWDSEVKRGIFERIELFGDDPVGWHNQPGNIFKCHASLHDSFERCQGWGLSLSLASCKLVKEALLEVDEDRVKVWSQTKGKRDTGRSLTGAITAALRRAGWSAYGLEYEFVVLRPDLFMPTDCTNPTYDLHVYDDTEGRPKRVEYIVHLDGELVDPESGARFPPFFHRQYRRREDELHSAAVVLNFLGKILWYERLGGDLESLSPRIRELVKEVEELAALVFRDALWHVPGARCWKKPKKPKKPWWSVRPLQETATEAVYSGLFNPSTAWSIKRVLVFQTLFADNPPEDLMAYLETGYFP